MISAFDNGFWDGILIVNAPLDSPKVVNIKVNYETANIFAQPICRLFFLYTGDDKMVNITDVKQILQFAIDAEIKVFLDGGWGVDALLGHQSRAHNDIDIFVEKKDYQNFIEIMKANDFYEIKMEYTTLNHTVWEDAKNRIVDLHCFEYTGEGEILYEGDCFPVETFSGKGKIEEIEVSCIEPYSQVMFHLGYEFDENDVHDVKLLCKTFHIEIPNEYR